MAKVLEFQLQHHSFQRNPRADLLQNVLVESPCSPRDSQESSPTPQFKSINFPPNSTSSLWEIHIHFSPPTNSGRSPDPASPPPFLLSATLWSLRVWGNQNGNPVLKRAPDLWEHPPALCVDQLLRKMRPHRQIFQSRTTPLTRKWQTQWGIQSLH